MKECTKCKEVKPLSCFCKGHHQFGLNHHCRDCKNESTSLWRRKHREKDAENSRKWRTANREKCRASCERWRQSNLEYNAARGRVWRKANPERAAELDALSKRKRRSSPSGKMAYRVGNRIRNALKNHETGRGGKTFDLLGYTPQELASHLERQFLPGMSWQNTSEWHIDHIVPLSSFDVSSKDDPELKRAWALTNLRPLWAEDNIRKGSKRVTLL